MSRPDRTAGRSGGRVALALAAVAGLAGTAAALPALDDLWSGLRPMAIGCHVETVIDGATVELRCPGEGQLRARIGGYAAPRLASPACAAEAEAGERARRALAGMVGASWVVEVAFLGTDRFGRAVVDMRLDGQRVARRMVEGGHARRYLGSLTGSWCR